MVIRFFAVALVMLLFPGPAARAELATGERIRSALSDNTLEGTMDASGQYIETYDPVGLVSADECGGKWTIVGTGTIILGNPYNF